MNVTMNQKMLDAELFRICDSVGDTDDNGHGLPTPISRFDRIQQLLKDGAKEIKCGGWTALHKAALHGHTEICHHLITVRSWNVNSLGKNNRNVLFCAAHDGRTETCQMLLKLGAEVNAADNTGWCPLLTAIVYHRPETCDFLLNNGATFATTKNKETALHMAARGVHIQGRGPCFCCNVREKDVRTECGIADMTATIQVVLQHLSRNPNANINEQDHFGRTALHSAAMRNHYEACEILIESGIDATLQDKDGNTALHLAAMYSGKAESVDRSACEFIFKNRKRWISGNGNNNNKTSSFEIQDIKNAEGMVPRRSVSGGVCKDWKLK
tara:strand:- start:206 stop:1186 length:981 start_codon:yes stop_codon:yes gene_type:complete